MPKLFCFLMIAAAANAQTLSVGILGGADFNNVVSGVNLGSYTPVVTSSNFTVGPSFQANLPLNLRLEVDALYRPFGFDLSGSAAGSYPVSAQQWRFPVLLGYRFKGLPLIHPFVEAGFSFDHLAGLSDAAKSVIVSGPGTLLHQSNADFVVGGGVDVKIPFIRLSGELRYSRATVSDFAALSNLNQAEVLFGIHF